MIYFTADTHFFHENIIKYTQRPFKSVKEMNNVIVTNWNKVVKKNDTVFFLGDFCFKGSFHKIKDKLQGNIIFILGNHDCFSKDTQLLTKDGYKNYYDLKVGELIPTVNYEKNIIEYKPIQKIIVNYVEKSYCFKNKTSDGVFSDNHKLIRLPYIPNEKKYYKQTTKDLWNMNSYIIVPTTNKSGNKKLETISDDELRLIAWLLTDGSLYKNSIGGNIWQSKPKYLKEIENLLINLNIRYNIKKTDNSNYIPYSKTICGKRIKSIEPFSYIFNLLSCAELKKINMLMDGNSNNIPKWAYLLSDIQANLFVDELIKGDGSICSKGTRVLWGNTCFLKQVMAFCVTHNLDASLIHWKGETYYLTIRKKTSECNKRGTRHIKKSDRNIQEYNDIMWCVCVENHNIFTQRNGKPLISGNSNNGIKSVITECQIEYKGQEFNLMHNPNPYNSNYEYNLCAHVHRSFKTKKVGKVLYINVGVDVWDFKPVSIQKIMEMIKNENIRTI